MSWLRFLNPFYTRRLERDFRQVVEASRTLASNSKRLAAEANALVDADAVMKKQAQKAMDEIAAGVEGMRGMLETISTDLACGKASDAKKTVDDLINIITGRAA